MSAIPHDLAHYAVERGPRIRNGLWGSVAEGTVCGSLAVAPDPLEDPDVLQPLDPPQRTGRPLQDRGAVVLHGGAVR